MILLIDVDSKRPNLALMKISTYFKNLNKEVELRKLNLDYYNEIKDNIIIDANQYEEVYLSLIFPINKNKVTVINCDKVYYGGTGQDLEIKLPKEIDDLEPDYSIYPDNDSSYGFITRGCIRNCYFCYVPKKEGMLYKYREPQQIIRHKKVYFMDNNFLAFNESKSILKWLVDNKIKCQFNQALDIRLIDDENAELISKLKYIGEYTFSFDNYKDKELIESKLILLKKYIPNDWKIKLFIYVNPNMPIVDTINRIEFCKHYKVLPYIMRDKTCWKSSMSEFYIDLAAYCNQLNIFKKMSYFEFINKRTNNKKRQDNFIELTNIHT